jgi:hypothetical protein
MCWVYEWAFAHRNLSSAIQHIERARLKMRFRASRFPKWREKYLEVARRCEEIIAQLQKLQRELEELIWTYDIIKRREYIEKPLTPPKMIPAEE